MNNAITESEMRGKTIPTARASEALIKKHSGAALKTLDEMGALDLVDILGLAAYTK